MATVLIDVGSIKYIESRREILSSDSFNDTSIANSITCLNGNCSETSSLIKPKVISWMESFKIVISSEAPGWVVVLVAIMNALMLLTAFLAFVHG